MAPRTAPSAHLPAHDQGHVLFTDLASTFEYVVRQSDRFTAWTLEHLILVLAAVATATVVAVTLSLLTYRRPRWSRQILNVQSVMLTIPSFALFALMIQPFGLGFRAPYIALVLYSLLAISRNTITGLQEVDSAIVDAARGMGMSRTRILLRIELPIAWPVIMAGVRVSTMLAVGIAAIAAVIGGPGLGDPILAGLSRIGGAGSKELVLGGTLLTLLVGLALDAFLLLVTMLTTPRGLRV